MLFPGAAILVSLAILFGADSVSLIAGAVALVAGAGLYLVYGRHAGD